MINLRKKLKIVFIVIIIQLILNGVCIYATYKYFAKDIMYTKKDGVEISVEEAINELYQKKFNEIIYKFGTNDRNNGIETIEIENDNDNAIIVSGQGGLEYSINSTDNFKRLTILGHAENGMGFYYSYISLKKGDIVYLRRNTSYKYGYALIY